MDGGSQLYKKLLKSWLRDSYIQIYSIVNEGKSVIAERFIRTSKKKKKKKLNAWVQYQKPYILIP